MTYGQLRSDVALFAAAMRKMGVGTGDRVVGKSQIYFSLSYKEKTIKNGKNGISIFYNFSFPSDSRDGLLSTYFLRIPLSSTIFILFLLLSTFSFKNVLQHETDTGSFTLAMCVLV